MYVILVVTRGLIGERYFRGEHLIAEFVFRVHRPEDVALDFGIAVAIYAHDFELARFQFLVVRALGTHAQIF